MSPPPAASPITLTYRRAATLLDGSSCDSAFGHEQVCRVFVHVDALTAAAIAARAAHRVVDCRVSTPVGEIHVGALGKKIFDHLIPAPKRRSVQGRLLES